MIATLEDHDAKTGWKRPSRALPQDALWKPGPPRTESQCHILELLSIHPELDSLALAKAIRRTHAATLMVLARMQGDCLLRRRPGPRRPGFHGPSIWSLRHHRPSDPAGPTSP